MERLSKLVDDSELNKAIININPLSDLVLDDDMPDNIYSQVYFSLSIIYEGAKSKKQSKH